MSIRVYLNKDSILYTAPAGKADKKQGIALDGLRHTFDTLAEVSERLESKIQQMTDGGRTGISFHTRQTARILADVWQMIDSFRRVSMFAIEAGFFIPNDVKPYLNKAKEYRDSYHHLEERIPDFFATNGLSVFWRLLLV